MQMIKREKRNGKRSLIKLFEAARCVRYSIPSLLVIVGRTEDWIAIGVIHTLRRVLARAQESPGLT